MEQYRTTLALVMAEEPGVGVPNPTRAEMRNAVELRIKQEAETLRAYLEVREEERIAWALHDATAEVLPKPGNRRSIFSSPLQHDMEEERGVTLAEFTAARARRDEVEADLEVQSRLARLRRLNRLREELHRLDQME